MWGLFALGAVIGAFSAASKAVSARAQAEKEQEYIEKMYAINKEKAEEEFAAAKEQADRNATRSEQQADLTDQSLNVSEKGISNDINAAIDNLYLNQEADTYSWNNELMQQSRSEGASYAGLAGTGVRAGSSLSDAVQLESAVNESQLQFSQDAKRRSDNNNLANVLNNLTGNRFNIQQNRMAADIQREDAAYLRNSYLEGGHNYNLYQNQLKALKETSDYNMTRAQYTIDQNSGFNMMLNVGTSAISTGTAFYTFGSKLKNFKANFGGYTGNMEG